MVDEPKGDIMVGSFVAPVVGEAVEGKLDIDNMAAPFVSPTVGEVEVREPKETQRWALFLTRRLERQ